MYRNLYSMAQCTPTEIAVIKLIRAAFSGEKLDKEEFVYTDWYAVFAELKAQAVAALPMDILPQVEALIPPELFNEWFAHSVQIMNYSEMILYAQSDLNKLLLQHDIPMGILKGTAAAYDYPNPLYRNMGDIDFLVDKNDFNKAYELLRDSGFKLAYDEDHVEYHLTLEKDGVIYELHREPAGIVHGAKGAKLRELFDNSCSYSEAVQIDSHEFYRLARLQNGMVLLLHIVKHLDEGLGIRQICDWMTFVNKELSDDVWENEFEPILQETGLKQLACTVTEMCRLYFGLTAKIHWCGNVDKTACAQFMRFVLDNGNFGRKDRNTNRARAVLGSIKNENNHSFIGGILVNLQKSGVEQWSAVNRFKVLRYIAWAYIPIRYMIRILTGKRSIKETAHLAKTIEKNKSLQDKLEIFK